MTAWPIMQLGIKHTKEGPVYFFAMGGKDIEVGARGIKIALEVVAHEWLLYLENFGMDRHPQNQYL